MSIRHGLRDTFIWLVSVLGVSAVYRARIRRRGPLVRVLAFHDVSDRAWFEAVVDMLSETYAVITPNEFHASAYVPDAVNILLTFDDGYASWTDTVLPVLDSRGLKGVFFISSGLLDVAGDGVQTKRFMAERLMLTHPRAPLTWEGARALVAAGHTIGGHTISHPRLSELDEAELPEEIAEDRASLEAKLGTTLEDFAYPFGTKSDYTDAARTVVERAGYTHIYTAETGFVGREPSSIPRTLLEEGQSPSSVKRWVNGGYDVFTMIKNTLVA